MRSFSVVVIPLPSLQIDLISSNTFVLAWPALASQAGFFLQATTNLDSPIVGISQTNPLTIVDDVVVVTNAANEPRQFHQLQRQ